MTVEEQIQKYDLQIQNIVNSIPSKYLLAHPPFSETEIIRLTRFLKLYRNTQKQSEYIEKQTDQSFIKQGRYWFRFVFLIGTVWLLIGYLTHTHPVFNFFVSLFISIITFWSILVVERKTFDREHVQQLNEIESLKNDLIRLDAIKSMMSKEYRTDDITPELVADMLEEYRMWTRHENERRAINELKQKINDLSHV